MLKSNRNQAHPTTPLLPPQIEVEEAVEEVAEEEMLLPVALVDPRWSK